MASARVACARKNSMTRQIMSTRPTESLGELAPLVCVEFLPSRVKSRFALQGFDMSVPGTP